MKKIRYTCLFLYVLFILQGIYGSFNFLNVEYSGSVNGHGVEGCCFYHNDANLLTSFQSFLVDDDDDDDQKRRLLSVFYKQKYHISTQYLCCDACDSGSGLRTPIILFFADASPPVIV